MKENNHLSDNTDAQSNTPDTSAQTRRNFLVKSSKGVGAGLLMAALPTKSVWATGIGNSMAASGHGSDLGGAVSLRIRGRNYLLNNVSSFELSQTFESIFGIRAFRGANNNYGPDVTLGMVLSGLDASNVADNQLRGPNNLNRNMAIVYFNALYHNGVQIVYPILDLGNLPPFDTPLNFANYLASSAVTDKTGTATALRSLVQDPNSDIV